LPWIERWAVREIVASSQVIIIIIIVGYGFSKSVGCTYFVKRRGGLAGG
jgi:hypothetical protein